MAASDRPGLEAGARRVAITLGRAPAARPARATRRAGHGPRAKPDALAAAIQFETQRASTASGTTIATRSRPRRDGDSDPTPEQKRWGLPTEQIPPATRARRRSARRVWRRDLRPVRDPRRFSVVAPRSDPLELTFDFPDVCERTAVLKRTALYLAACEGTRRDNLNGLTVMRIFGAERVPDAGTCGRAQSIEAGSPARRPR